MLTTRQMWTFNANNSINNTTKNTAKITTNNAVMKTLQSVATAHDVDKLRSMLTVSIVDDILAMHERYDKQEEKENEEGEEEIESSVGSSGNKGDINSQILDMLDVRYFGGDGGGGGGGGSQQISGGGVKSDNNSGRKRKIFGGDKFVFLQFLNVHCFNDVLKTGKYGTVAIGLLGFLLYILIKIAHKLYKQQQATLSR
jgi:hypothetical protein